MSKKEVLQQFIALTSVLVEYPFAFIPVGFNLMFEHSFLKVRSVANGLPEIGICSRPTIDLKSVGVLMRHGEFKGTSLDALTSKSGTGLQVIHWLGGDYAAIEAYIRQEATAAGVLLLVVRANA